MKKFFRWMIGDWWTVRRCTFPYPSGFATYNSFRRTILDTGLTRENAQEICDAMNGARQ